MKSSTSPASRSLSSLRNCLFTLILVLGATAPGLAQANDEGVPLDANKPLRNGKVPNTDLSCWMASAANMMAADDWARVPGQDGQALANQIFSDLRSAFGATVGGVYRCRGGFQSQAIAYYNAKYKLDTDEFVDVWNSWNQRRWQGGIQGWDSSPRQLIDNLLNTTTGDPPPNEGPSTEGPDDPIGIGFQSVDRNGNIIWGRGGIAHAVTIWGDANNQLSVTDSDDTQGGMPVDGTQMYQWADNGNSNTDFIYNGKRVRITYISFLADTSLNNRRPDTFNRPLGFGADSENDPTFVPEPSAYATFLAGTFPLGLAWWRRRKRGS